MCTLCRLFGVEVSTKLNDGCVEVDTSMLRGRRDDGDVRIARGDASSGPPACERRDVDERESEAEVSNERGREPP